MVLWCGDVPKVMALEKWFPMKVLKPREMEVHKKATM
jgi:hypothetical protein